MVSNEAIAQLNSEILNSEFLFLYLNNYNWNSLGNTSSIATAVNSKTIKNMDILIPSSKILILFKELIFPLFQKMKENSNQIQTLTQLRDSLLPRLMSGKIEISE